MMQMVEARAARSPDLPVIAASCLKLSPEIMAQHLRRSGGDAALCFARAIYEDAAWANEAWGAYWADVVRHI